jgi:hypothetical protein
MTTNDWPLANPSFGCVCSTSQSENSERKSNKVEQHRPVSQTPKSIFETIMMTVLLVLTSFC